MSDKWKTATDFRSWSWVIASRNINEKLRTHKRTDIQKAVDNYALIPINTIFYFKIYAEIIAERENKNQTETNKQKPKRHSGDVSELSPVSIGHSNTWFPFEGCLEKIGRSGLAIVCHWEKVGFEVLKDLLHFELALSATRIWMVRRVLAAGATITHALALILWFLIYCNNQIANYLLSFLSCLCQGVSSQQ